MDSFIFCGCKRAQVLRVKDVMLERWKKLKDGKLKMYLIIFSLAINFIATFSNSVCKCGIIQIPWNSMNIWKNTSRKHPTGATKRIVYENVFWCVQIIQSLSSISLSLPPASLCLQSCRKLRKRCLYLTVSS